MKLRWLRVVFCLMLLGGLWRLNEHYAWMSMREKSVNAANSVLEERFWDIFPSQSLRFWPLFIRKSQDVAAFFEKTNPVLVETRMTGMGSFVTDIKLLSPHIIVEWRGELWLISKEGRMWNLADENFGFMEMKIPRGPIWRMPVTSAVHGYEQPLPGGVFPSIFSMDAIDDLLEGLGNAPWFDSVEEVTLDRRVGADLFVLRYVREEQIFKVLIQRGRHAWEELNFALEHILGRIGEEDGNRLIDATYRDRIVVKDLPADAVEGGSR